MNRIGYILFCITMLLFTASFPIAVVWVFDFLNECVLRILLIISIACLMNSSLTYGELSEVILVWLFILLIGLPLLEFYITGCSILYFIDNFIYFLIVVTFYIIVTAIQDSSSINEGLRYWIETVIGFFIILIIYTLFIPKIPEGLNIYDILEECINSVTFVVFIACILDSSTFNEFLEVSFSWLIIFLIWLPLFVSFMNGNYILDFVDQFICFILYILLMYAYINASNDSSIEYSSSMNNGLLYWIERLIVCVIVVRVYIILIDTTIPLIILSTTNPGCIVALSESLNTILFLVTLACLINSSLTGHEVSEVIIIVLFIFLIGLPLFECYITGCSILNFIDNFIIFIVFVSILIYNSDS